MSVSDIFYMHDVQQQVATAKEEKKKINQVGFVLKGYPKGI